MQKIQACRNKKEEKKARARKLRPKYFNLASIKSQLRVKKQLRELRDRVEPPFEVDENKPPIEELRRLCRLHPKYIPVCGF